MAEANVNVGTSISRRTSSRTKAPKKSQLPYGIAILLVMIIFGLYLLSVSATLGIFWLTGCCFGFILQKSRFCFTASFRDPVLTGSTSITRAVLIALAVTSIIFTAVKYQAYMNGLPIPGQSYVVPISICTAIGGILFGTGMVIAGGCASGTLMRVGEGFTMQMVSLFFFIVGSLWGAHDFGWWKLNFILSGREIFMPDVFGWFGAIVVQLLIIGLLYIAADKWENRKVEEN
ncbi:MAG: YeeE/YedE thiosulfate transporter family protein [Dehalobacterium sp.]